MLKNVQLPICKYETRKIYVFSHFLDAVKKRQETDALNRMIQLVITQVQLLIRFLWPFALIFCMILSACGYKMPTNKLVTEAQLLRLLGFYTVEWLCIINPEMTDT